VPSQQSLLALSWLNFFLSGMQTAFGPIAAAYLAIQGWTAKNMRFALTMGVPPVLLVRCLVALVDAVRAKRLLVATGVVTVALSVLIFRLWPSFPLVALADVLQGIKGDGVLGPTVVAITLGLVGQARLAERPERNQRFLADGGVAVTPTMALVAYSQSPWAMFVLAALALP
jgi:hypothetical protein